MSLTIGLKIDEFELLKPLRQHSNATWLAQDSAGKNHVLRFLSYYGMSSQKAPIDLAWQSLNIEGYLPFSSQKLIQLGKIYYWMLARPYLAQRFSDEITPGEKANSHLLNRLADYAQIFDKLEAAVPTMGFDLAAGNLLLDEDKPLVVDIGLARLAHFADGNNRSPSSSYIEQERRIPLTAAYPGIWSYPYLGSGADYKNTIKRTDAQFAITALYIWLKTRYLVFEDPQNPYPSLDLEQRPFSIQSPEFMAMIEWQLKISKLIRAYEEKGQLDLLMISNEQERAVLLKGLHRDRSQAYSSALALVNALREIY